MKNILLYISTVLIWGSTWYAIIFQVGEVHPIISVSYRFAIAGFILLIFAKLKGLNLSYSLQEHLYMLLQGLFLFGFNYWLIYSSEISLTSGLVALIFSTLVFMNIFNARVFLKNTIPLKVYMGALLGLTGIVMIFYTDVLSFSFSSTTSIALLLAISGAYISSLGNIISARNQTARLPIIQSNAFGMIYGSIAMAIMALIMGIPFSYEFTFSYSISLIYLSIFGSILAFGSYLTLIGSIGPSRAGYVQLVVPVIALSISTIFENYQWTLLGLFGVVFILVGNLIVIEKKRTAQAAAPLKVEVE